MEKLVIVSYLTGTR